jgi:hypothetical protein
MRNLYLIFGLIMVTAGLTAVFIWWNDSMVVARGCLGVAMILAGAAVLFIARNT